jgi:predicted DNA-binding transcriptional regulator AlpA
MSITKKKMVAPESWAQYLRAGALAKRLGISRATIYNILKKPELEFPRGIKLGGAVVYSVAAVDIWMQKRAELSGANVVKL